MIGWFVTIRGKAVAFVVGAANRRPRARLAALTLLGAAFAVAVACHLILPAGGQAWGN